MQLSIFDLPPAPEPMIAPVIVPDLLAELTQAADELRSHPDLQPTMAMLDALPEVEPAIGHSCGVCFDCPGTLTGQSWQCAVNPDHRALVDLAALDRDLPANWITSAQEQAETDDHATCRNHGIACPDCATVPAVMFDIATKTVTTRPVELLESDLRECLLQFFEKGRLSEPQIRRILQNKNGIEIRFEYLRIALDNMASDGLIKQVELAIWELVEPDTQELPNPLPVAVGIEGSACNFCGSPMVKHHPNLPVWRCTADEWHRFWRSKDGEGKKAKRIGVWLGHSRADPGSGPGEIPEWAEK